MKDINARLERIEPQVRSDGLAGNFAAGEIKAASLNPKRSSPKAKSSSREMSLFGGSDALTSNFANILVFIHIHENLCSGTYTYVHTSVAFFLFQIMV